MKNHIVTIVGRTNVGKSTLFNKLIGRREAIISDIPGTTRDILKGVVEWNGEEFQVIDTAGAEHEGHYAFGDDIKEQIEAAVAVSDLIIFLTDAREGLQPLDLEVAKLLRKWKVVDKTIVAANKLDTTASEPNVPDFRKLGFGEVHPVSVHSGRGIGDMLDDVVERLKTIEKPTEDLEEEDSIKLALLGRPNVGKSTLFNRLIQQYRTITSNIPGTTRDAVSEKITVGDKQYTFIDTAGLRKKSKAEKGIEVYGNLRSIRALRYADIVLILIDSLEGITNQDKHIIELAIQSGKGIILLVNKWDALEKDDKTQKHYQDYLSKQLSFATWIPVLFISALTGQRVEKLFELIDHVHKNRTTKLPVNAFERMIADAYANVPPRGKMRGKIIFAKQVDIQPPTFKLATTKELHTSYLRYLENQIRSQVDLIGTPIQIDVEIKR